MKKQKFKILFLILIIIACIINMLIIIKTFKNNNLYKTNEVYEYLEKEYEKDLNKIEDLKK